MVTDPNRPPRPGRRSAPDDDTFTLPRPRPRKLLWGLVALALVGGLSFAGYRVYHEVFVKCADGVSRKGSDDECVGVTGSYVFDKTLKKVTDKIAAENRAVEDSGKPWVSVVYLEPMTLGPNDKSKQSIQQEIEGAYLAQAELNSQTGGRRGAIPQIKLLLANSGKESAQWEPLVEQIVSMSHRDGNGRVVAVAGLGQSLGTTKKAVIALREAGVPMIGSTVTADDLSSATRLGFFRVAPSNSDEASAAAKHLKELQSADPDMRIQVIKDRNTDDIYSKSLRDGFDRAANAAGLTRMRRELSYVSRKEGVDNALASIADKVCDQKPLPDAVYFAGRGRELKLFIEAVGANGRHCGIKVFTGDDAVGLFYDIPWDEKKREYERFNERWRSSGVTVRYTALAHPDEPADLYGKDEGNPFTAFSKEYADQFSGRRGLLSGQAMMGHDAMLTAGRAIRKAAGDNGEDKVSTESVLNMLNVIDDKGPVRGVSGKIDFGDLGDPVNKPMALVELKPEADDAYEYVKVVRP